MTNRRAFLLGGVAAITVSALPAIVLPEVPRTVCSVYWQGVRYWVMSDAPQTIQFRAIQNPESWSI